jgi:diaminohydroxyphosphoribosylaminopyrimidine deaminase / 5-amino-6-(5-phosphoribosylamino)uracil reductase
MSAASAVDAAFMHRALALASRAEGETNPNPMVGCVVVSRGQIAGEGFHARAGDDHAEVVALKEAAARARGATLYVNLEPCVHFGRTPPCAPRIIEAGIRRVVVAHRDPNPVVRGKGIAMLRRSGVQVHVGLLASEAAVLNRRFLVAHKKRRPYVLLKAAMTLDGFVAAPSGDSRWITPASHRRSARRLRRLHDGVVVGLGTVLHDDPMLLPSPGLARSYHRIVLDSRFRIPLASRLVRTARRSGLIVIGCESAPKRRRALERLGVTTLKAAATEGQVALRSALGLLWQRGVTSVMVEGGSAILGSFVRARCLDEIALYRGGLVLGGIGSLPAFGTPGSDRIRDALRLVRRSVRHDVAPPSKDAAGDLSEHWFPAR